MMVLLVRTVVIILVFQLPSEWALASFQHDQAPSQFAAMFVESNPGRDLIEVVQPNEGIWLYLHQESLITNEDVIEARAVYDMNTDPKIYTIFMVFTGEADARMAKAAQRNKGKLIALLLDGKVISIARLDVSVAGRAMLNMRLTREKALQIADALNRK